MNYSLLLTRSIDFDPFAQVLYPAYPDELIRPLLLSLIQTLWDRGEPDGYAWHMTTDPYPNTPAHTVLLHMAFGDHQVANVATEVEARTIGAKIRLPAVDPGRHTDVHPYYGIEPITQYPYRGSALVVWDIGPLRGDLGTPPPPITNTAPRLGRDPHGITGREAGGAAAVLALHRRRVHRRLPRACPATPPGGPAREALRRARGAIALAPRRARRRPVVPAPHAPPGCDPIGTGNCLFPWPNDYFRKHGHLALTRVDDAAQQRRRPDRPERLQPRGRLQPGRDDRAQGARARHAGGASRRPARCRSPTSRARTTARRRSW